MVLKKYRFNHASKQNGTQSRENNVYWFQYLAAITGLLNILSSGMVSGWPSASLPQLLAKSSPVSMTNFQTFLVIAMQNVGSLVGNLISIPLLDKIGRKYTILSTSLPFIASWIITGFAGTVAEFYVARFLGGMGESMIFGSLSVYFGEIAHPNIRGLLGSGLGVLFTAGMFVMNILGSLMTMQMCAFASAVVPTVTLFTFAFMPESPYYLTMRNKHEYAKKALQRLRQCENVQEELSSIQREVKAQNENTGKFLGLFTVRSNRKALFLCLLLRTMQPFSGYMAILFYASLIFQKAGGISENVSTIIYFGVQVLTNITSSFLLDKWGRKPLLIISLIGSGVALAIEGIYFYFSHLGYDLKMYNLVPLIVLIAYVMTNSLGLETIPILMMGELYPTNVKAFAINLSNIYFSVTVMATSQFLEAMLDSSNIHITFFVFSGCCALATVLTHVYIIETKGITLEEIQEQLTGK